MNPALLHDITFWLLIGGGGAILALVLLSTFRGRLRHHYRRHFAESRRERHFIASLTFFLTFAIVRLITHSIRAGRGPFHNVETAGGRHIHHLVFGILLLLIVGFFWLSQIGTGMGRASVWAGRLTAFFFAIGAALTLDEFALWFNLADVYWSPQGVASVRAVFLFGAVLSVGFWGGPFLQALARDLFRGNKPVKP
ncbi:MAG TPA: hypothetical protein VE998_10240 [Terriglobales bacterium]|nr:hypothetical protein [Terriglobales bacterium]